MAEQQHSSEAGLRKYFFFIKEKVSSDWKDLAFHLGFEQADIDNIAGRNRDDKSSCMDLLEEWLKRSGDRATTEALIEALSEANLQSTVDGLKNIFPELDRPQTASNLQQRKMSNEDQSFTKQVEQGSHIKDVFQKSVKPYYELRLTRFTPLIWNDNFALTTGDIFTELELLQTDGHTVPNQNFWSAPVMEKQTRKLTTLDDLFNPDVTGRSKPPRCILIEGEAGGGKTMFLSKEALDAVLEKTELGRRHDIVLFIRLREVREAETIAEMVWDQCVPETTEGVDVQSIRAILQKNESRVLFLLDGYDELRPEARTAGQVIPKLLAGKMFPNSSIVITSRPSAGVQQYTQPDCHVRIMGFSPEHVEKYVRQYFSITGKPELAKELISQPFIVDVIGLRRKRLSNTGDGNENQLVTDLIHTPIFLMLVCILWEEDQEMIFPGTMTGLYSNLLTCLVRKHHKREGLDMPTDGLPAEVADALLQLGKVALEALLRNETLVDLSEVKRQNVNWELLLKLGAVSLENSASKLHPRKQLNFSHKTMQEFLAGRYVAHAVVNQDIVELLQLTSITRALELSNLLQFTCGCGSQAAQAVMKELNNLSSEDFINLQTENINEQLYRPPVPITAKTMRSAEMYKRFVLLCLDILNERKEPGVLHAVCRALPVLAFYMFTCSKPHSGLKYYLENIQSSDLPDRMIMRFVSIDQTIIQYLEQTFTSLTRGLRLDLKLPYIPVNSPDEIARFVSVLKNVPSLRALELSRSNLTPSLLRPLVRGFSHVSLLEELDLSCCPYLGDAGIYVLQAGLSSVPHLSILRLGWVNLTAVGMLSLAPHMRRLAGLRELDVNYNNRIGDIGLLYLTGILPSFTAMQVLDLGLTGITSRGMRTLVPALRQLNRLIKLDISENAIGDPGLECLSDILVYLTAMKALYLNAVRISDTGLSALVRALPHLIELQVLDVSSNKIGDSGIVSLVQTLCQPSSLDKEQSPPADKSLDTAFCRNATLRELYISRNAGVTYVGVGMVTQLISALPALTKLDVSLWHRSKGPLTETVARMFYLHLPPKHLPDTASMALAEALPRLPALEELYLFNISMGPAGFQAVAQAAEDHPALFELQYSRDGVPEGADTSARCLDLISPPFYL